MLHTLWVVRLFYRFLSFSSPSSSLYEPQPLWFFQLPKHSQQNSWRHLPHVWNQSQSTKDWKQFIEMTGRQTCIHLPYDCSHHSFRSVTCTLDILLCILWCTKRFHRYCLSAIFRSSSTKSDHDSRHCNWSRSCNRIGMCIFVDRPTADWPLLPDRMSVRGTNAIDDYTSQSCLLSSAGTFGELLYRKSFAWLYHRPQWCHTFRPDS